MSQAMLQIAKVVGQEQLQEGIYSLWLSCDAAKSAEPGQFVNLFSKDGVRLLPRPISICDVDADKRALRLVYRVAGAGTKEFSALAAGNEVKLLGPLGNGFPLSSSRSLLFGGGIGVPPMLLLTKQLIAMEAEPVVVLGYLDEPFLLDEFEKTGARVIVSTESGAYGTKGNVMDAVKNQIQSNRPDISGNNGGESNHLDNIDGTWQIFSCGPKLMLAAVKHFAEQQGIEQCYLSMEERMACGIGACLGCVTQATEIDEHSKVKNKRVCKDGPVFLAKEVAL